MYDLYPGDSFSQCAAPETHRHLDCERDYRLSMPKSTHVVFAATILCIGLGLTACGSASRNTGASTTPSAATRSAQATRATGASPSEVVARVGTKPITWAMVVHGMALGSREAPLPDPPGYAACVKHLQASAAQAGTPAESEATLKRACRTRYTQLLRGSLGKAIHDQWLIGEAAELGIRVRPQEVRAEFEQSKKAAFRTEAEFERYRKNIGESVPELMFELKVGKLTEKIFKKLERQQRPVTDAEVIRYYESHRENFKVPKGRAVRIVRTATRGSASRVTQELKSGKSFSAVAKELSAIGQPIGAKNGEVEDLKPGVFEEKKLNDAIFSAKFDRLYGPLQLTAIHKTIAPETNTGFFIFEVTKTTPASQTPLAKIKTGLARELAKARRDHTVPPFILAYRHKWKARTDCKPGYVLIYYCRQYKSSKAQEDVDPYTL
jgi:foldase protein PrsA